MDFGLYTPETKTPLPSKPYTLECQWHVAGGKLVLLMVTSLIPSVMLFSC